MSVYVCNIVLYERVGMLLSVAFSCGSLQNRDDNTCREYFEISYHR
jgi:hypothetical protein